jgi:peroxiredoxin
MVAHLHIGDRFPDIELPDQQNELTRLSQFTQPSPLDNYLGFLDGYR